MRANWFTVPTIILFSALITACGNSEHSSSPPPTTTISAPAVTSVSPSSGGTAGGTAVTITGTTFTGATAVKFGTANATSFTVDSATSISAVSPAGSAGAVDIVVTTPAGSSAASAADQFTYVAPPPATAEGLWNGTTTGPSRTISGVVTKEGSYWLLYSQAGNSTIASGFYAGLGASTDGSFPSSNLREFNFESSGAAQGTLTSTYTQSLGYTSANTLAGSFEAVTASSAYNISLVGSTYVDAADPAPKDPNTPNITIAYTGTWNSTTKLGTLNGVIGVTAYGLTLNTVQTFNMDPATGIGNPGLNQASSCTDTAGGAACNGFVPAFKGRLYNGAAPDTSTAPTATPFTPASSTSTWALRISSTGTDGNGDPVVINTYNNLATTLTAQSLPSITANTFTSTYNSLYETTPLLTALAGSYTGSAGVVNSTASATLVAANDGTSFSGVVGACSYTATVAIHPTGGNVFDVSALTFTGGGCAYTASGAFAGVARYDGTTKEIVVTATNVARDKGFMFVGTKP